ncbi:hypothetical protein NO559_12785 [Dasania sp. GY-MA-18]|uniref:Uncharacterized protein n=1 Tax=Dasania phycosphaerae TaxID=2950436 RepID=A0A9J6RMY3_9GAMM|nr:MULTISPECIES: hypothetical protein [Dasania]MCR8923652.1 hypothetical protein [Dasania sp. GY-MA-18]MCZ0866086.1 hypothetical protein [Dasania phycosphaerae]MCZ0869810.1 hypothetical protein [Dasania phycosphaerae]
MAAIVFNTALIGQRGGNLCGEDELSIEACSSCQGQYLFNAALKDVYYDSADLSRHFFKIPAIDLPPCRYCGALQWQFATPAPELAQVQAGPWAWVLASRVFTFDAEA